LSCLVCSAQAKSIAAASMAVAPPSSKTCARAMNPDLKVHV
jgi:hypothetical protein